jgi:hypothetical protein
MSDKEQKFKEFVSKCITERLEHENKKVIFTILAERLEKEGYLIPKNSSEIPDEVYPVFQHAAADKIIRTFRMYKLKKQLKLLTAYSISKRYNRVQYIQPYVAPFTKHSNLYEELNKLEI